MTVHGDRFLIIKPTRCTNFSNLFLYGNYKFRTVPLSIIRSFHCTHSNGICYTGLLDCLKFDGTCAKTRFRLSAKQTSPFKLAGHQFSWLLAAEVCASAVVMLDTPSSGVVWRVMATHSASFPFTSPSKHHHVPSHFKWTLPALEQDQDGSILILLESC